MPLPSIKNSVGMAVTAVASAGVGTITLGAALSGGYQTAATAYGANANIDIRIEEGDTWEVCRDCTYTHSGTTVTRGTLEDGSSGASTRVAFTTAAKVYVVESAERVYHNNLTSRGHIEGGVIGYSSTTAITVAACKLDINGKIMESAEVTLTSGSTMLDLAGSTVTIDASKAYFVYAYNNSGTLAFRIVERTGSGEGADPTWDSNLDYWKAPSTGANARRIGKFWTNSSSNVSPFYANMTGRLLTVNMNDANEVTLVNAGTSTTYASITKTPFFTDDDLNMLISLTQAMTVSTAASSYIHLSVDNASSFSQVGVGKGSLSYAQSFGSTRIPVPVTGSLHYKVTANNQGYVRASGFEEYV